MTIQLMQQIQSAERGLTMVDSTADPRFVPDTHVTLRELSARLLRSTADRGLQLADRLDPDAQYA
jgi:hypothetical protein